MVTQLGYLGISIKEPRQWEWFATKVLGLQVYAQGGDGSMYLRMDHFHHRIVLHPTGQDDVAYIGWMVAGPGELKALAERLKANGVPYQEGTEEEAQARRVTGLIRFQDPLDITHEAFYGLLAAEEPFHPGRPMASRFVTGSQGLGHVFLQTKSEEETEKALQFFSECLGLRLSDFIDFEAMGEKVHAIFMHCNPRHHTLALAKMPQVERRLNHFELEVESIDDVGLAYDICLRNAVPLAATLGRHTNDRMFSFYVQTPSGFAVEYGFGGRTIDNEAEWVVQRYTSTSIWGHDWGQVLTQDYLRRVRGQVA
jgi:extradiol dioxygenase